MSIPKQGCQQVLAMPMSEQAACHRERLIGLSAAGPISPRQFSDAKLQQIEWLDQTGSVPEQHCFCKAHHVQHATISLS